MLNSRHRRPLERDERPLRDCRLIIIATEGSKTEKIYFESFRDTRVQVRVIPSVGGNSSPQHILENLREFRSSHDLNDDDELWIVIDKDRWPERSLSEVAAACVNEKYNLSVSNPCFELWLLLHISENIPEPIDAKVLENELRSIIGSYNKSNIDMEVFNSGIDRAIAKATEMDINPEFRWPMSVGTRVYRVVDRLRLLALQR